MTEDTMVWTVEIQWLIPPPGKAERDPWTIYSHQGMIPTFETRKAAREGARKIDAAFPGTHQRVRRAWLSIDRD